MGNGEVLEDACLGTQYYFAVPCKVGYHGKVLFKLPWIWQKLNIQNSVSKSALKITTKIKQDITDDTGMRSDFGQTNSKPTFDQ